MTHKQRKTIIAAFSLALVVAGSATTASGGRTADSTRLPRGSEPVRIDPTEFSPNIDNRRWPMTVGSRWIYRVTDMVTGSVKRQVITVTRRTKVMADGVRARVVTDVVTDHGKPVEVTQDWYAEDRVGNVWYFGEHTIAVEHGKTTDNGSWQAGIGGAMPGVALPARMKVSLSYREEYSKGVAEDQSRILAVDAQAQVQAGHYENVVLAEDFSPIEPDVSELKFYARGSGQAVLAIDVSGGSDREELISYTR
jgi:hypothetical protein